MPKDSKTAFPTSVRFPPGLWNGVKEQAKRENRSANNLAVVILTEGLAKRKRRKAEGDDATD